MQYSVTIFRVHEGAARRPKVKSLPINSWDVLHEEFIRLAPEQLDKQVGYQVALGDVEWVNNASLKSRNVIAVDLDHFILGVDIRHCLLALEAAGYSFYAHTTYSHNGTDAKTGLPIGSCWRLWMLLDDEVTEADWAKEAQFDFLLEFFPLHMFRKTIGADGKETHRPSWCPASSYQRMNYVPSPGFEHMTSTGSRKVAVVAKAAPTQTAVSLPALTKTADADAALKEFEHWLERYCEKAVACVGGSNEGSFNSGVHLGGIAAHLDPKHTDAVTEGLKVLGDSWNSSSRGRNGGHDFNFDVLRGFTAGMHKPIDIDDSAAAVIVANEDVEPFSAHIEKWGAGDRAHWEAIVAWFGSHAHRHYEGDKSRDNAEGNLHVYSPGSGLFMYEPDAHLQTLMVKATEHLSYTDDKGKKKFAGLAGASTWGVTRNAKAQLPSHDFTYLPDGWFPLWHSDDNRVWLHKNGEARHATASDFVPYVPAERRYTKRYPAQFMAMMRSVFQHYATSWAQEQAIRCWISQLHYGLVGRGQEVPAIWMQGNGHDGKSTLLLLSSLLVGERASYARRKTALESIGRFDDADHDGIRILGLEDVSFKDIAACETVMKDLTMTPSPLNAEKKGKQVKKRILPKHLVMLGTNSRFTVIDPNNADAIGRRLVPYPMQKLSSTKNKNIVQRVIDAEGDAIVSFILDYPHLISTNEIIDNKEYHWNEPMLAAWHAIIEPSKEKREMHEVFELPQIIESLLKLADAAGGPSYVTTSEIEMAYQQAKNTTTLPASNSVSAAATSLGLVKSRPVSALTGGKISVWARDKLTRVK